MIFPMPENNEQLPLVQQDSHRQQLASYHERQRARQQRRKCSTSASRAVVILIASAFCLLLGYGLIMDDEPSKLAKLLCVNYYSKNFSGVIQVSQNGQKQVEGAMGIANIPFKQLMTPQNVFPMGTHVHLLVAIALLQLQEQKLVDLQSAVSDQWTNDDWLQFGLQKKGTTTWCPTLEMERACQVVTFRHLLSMRSGIRTQKTQTMPIYASFGHQIGTFLNKSLAFPPGTSYKYAAENYVLLAYMVEKLSQLRITEYFKKYIFQPLKLHHTTYDPFVEAVNVRDDAVDEYVQFYVRKNGTKRIRNGSKKSNDSRIESDLVVKHFDHMSTGSCAIYKGVENSLYGLYSTSEDMHKLYADLFHDHGRHSKLLTPDSVAQLVQMRNVATPAFGLGIEVDFQASRNESQWPSKLAFCGTTTCSTTCIAMQMFPKNMSIIASAFTNDVHLFFPSVDALQAYKPNDLLKKRKFTSDKEAFEQDDDVAKTLASSLLQIYLQSYATFG